MDFFNSFTFQSNSVRRLASAARFQLVSGLALPPEVELVERKRMSAGAQTPTTRPRTHRAWSRERSILLSGSDVCTCYRDILMYPPLSLMSDLFFCFLELANVCIWIRVFVRTVRPRDPIGRINKQLRAGFTLSASYTIRRLFGQIVKPKNGLTTSWFCYPAKIG